MPNILDYLTWRGDVSLCCKPFNAVDNLVLSEFAYLLLEHVPSHEETLSIRELNEMLRDHPSAFGAMEKDNRRLLEKMAEGERFSTTTICLYRHETDLALEKQFAAVTLLLKDDTAFVAYRGTDNTLVGWKEDFNLSFTSAVPAQIAAVQYLCNVSLQIPHALRVGGHSKGGNLAVFAAANCPEEVSGRIVEVYSNDGPGMDEAVFQSAGYARIANKIHSILPQSSIIGMLLQHQETYMVINSNAFGIFQHNPFSWQVTHNGFEVIEALRPGSIYMDIVLKKWLEGISVEERMTFIDTLFTVLTASRATTVNNLTEGVIRNAFSMLAAVKNIDTKTRRCMAQVVKALFKTALESYST